MRPQRPNAGAADAANAAWQEAAKVPLSRHKEGTVAANSRLMIGDAEPRFPCRIKLGVPSGGFGKQLSEMHA
jgi:hypothetical protein